jgi:hydroxymethylpyrimidine pyrophosphatase-like HAD family hydrolase
MSNTSIALVISDIDGTLITSNHEVTDATKAAAAKLYERGVELSLASSRPPRSIVPLADSLKLRGPFAAFNGLLGAYSPPRRSQASKPLPTSLVLAFGFMTTWTGGLPGAMRLSIAKNTPQGSHRGSRVTMSE